MVVALAMILTAGGLLASNMGFKLNYQLKATGSALPEGGTSASGTNTIALPFNAQTGLTNASGLRTDIGAASTLSVSKFLRTTDLFQIYTGVKGSAADFSLVAGEGYMTKMSADVDYIIVGSHNPSLAIGLDPTGVNGSASGTNVYAYPYHSTSASASALRNEIGAANVLSVQKFLRGTDLFQIYTGVKGSAADFTLNPGEAYFIKISGGSTINYTPSHY
jgi:hypothetical protein